MTRAQFPVMHEVFDELMQMFPLSDTPALTTPDPLH